MLKDKTPQNFKVQYLSKWTYLCNATRRRRFALVLSLSDNAWMDYTQKPWVIQFPPGKSLAHVHHITSVSAPLDIIHTSTESLHLLEGIKAEAFNKRLNLSDKWDKCIHDLFAALIPSEGSSPHFLYLQNILWHAKTGPSGAAGCQFTVKSNQERVWRRSQHPARQQERWCLEGR